MMIFKIIETLILNANTTSIQQVFGPKKLSGLSRNGPQDFTFQKQNFSGFRNLQAKISRIVESRFVYMRWSLGRVTLTKQNSVLG